MRTLHRRVILPTLLASSFAWIPARGLAQAVPAVEDDPRKVANDNPTRPLQMPAASSEVKEAFDDFERFKRRGAWERATKALDTIPDAQLGRFVDGQDGFIIPVARKRHAILGGMSPEGLAAYRLFHDADAKKLLDQAEGAAEQATLERLYSAYFLTTVGDNAADRLGDLAFELGRFDRAAECWLAVFRDRPDSDLSPALLGVKATLALARAGRRAEAEALRAELAERFGGDEVTLGGRRAPLAEHLRGIMADPAPAPVAESAGATPDAAGPTLPATVGAAWQVRFGASVMAGMTGLEAAQWDDNTLSYAVPRLAIAGPALFANYLGHVFAVDLASGKMLWRSAPFHNIEVPAMADQARTVDASRYAVVAGLGYVWSLGRDLKDTNYQATAHLACRRAENGELAWQTNGLPDFAGLDLVGQPILARATLVIAAKSVAHNGQGGQPHQYILAIRPHDGKLLWKAQVATFRESQQYYYYRTRDNAPQPRLTYHAGAIYVDTHQGVLARLDAETGAIEWGYGYRTEPIQGQGRFFFFGMQDDKPTPIGAAPLVTADGLLIKGARSERIAAIDPDRLKVAWDRPIAQGSRLLGVDAGLVFLGGPDLNAFDRATKALRWSLPLPGGSADGQVLLRPDGLWQFTPRGIFEVDAASGRVRRIFRGDDPAGACGDLLLTDRWLVAVSNRAISAYPRGQVEADRAAGPAAAELKARGSDE